MPYHGVILFCYNQHGFRLNSLKIKNQIRPESKSVRSCHRAEFSDQKRRFSIKQFLYDWALSAYDHPCLWRNAEISKPENTPLPFPRFIENNYRWVGLDYRRKPAATINKHRTQIELTVLDGSITDDEVFLIFKNLQPVCKDNKEKIMNLSFATLTHAYRHDLPISSVPTGYLEYLRNENDKLHCYSAADLHDNLIPEKQIQVELKDYFLDSLFIVKNKQGITYEIEYYFENRMEKDNTIRIMVTPSDHLSSIPYPAKVSDQECNFLDYKLASGHTLYHAWPKTTDYGSHSMIFRKKDLIFNLSIKPAPWTTLTWARELCQEIYKQI